MLNGGALDDPPAAFDGALHTLRDPPRMPAFDPLPTLARIEIST